MGERASRIEQAEWSGDGHRAPSASPPETVRLLGAEIAEIREDLGGLVAELDRRRHDLLDLRLQLRRHGPAVAAVVISFVGAAAGIVWLGVWRVRKRRTLMERAVRLGRTVKGMIDSPERVAAVAPTPVAIKILTTAATTVAGTAVHWALTRAMETLRESASDARARADRDRRDSDLPS